MFEYLVAVLPFLLLFAAYAITKIPFSVLFDRVTFGRYNRDRDELEALRLSLLREPLNWRVHKDHAVFPKDGRAWKVLITEQYNGLFVELDSFENEKKKITGYYKFEIGKLIADKHRYNRTRSIARTLFSDNPELSYLLEDKRYE